MRDTDWFTTAVNEAKARVSQWPPELQQVASASLPSLEQQLAHEKRQADRIAELEREVEALKRAGYVVSMALLQSGTYHTLCDDETRASVDAFKPRLKEQNKC